MVQSLDEGDEIQRRLDEKQKQKYIQRYCQKLLRIKGVQNVIAYNKLGIPKQSTFSHSDTICKIGLFDELLLKVNRAIQIICPGDEFVSIRLRTHNFEIFIAADLDDLYFVIFQNPTGKYIKHLFCRIFSIIEMSVLVQSLININGDQNSYLIFLTEFEQFFFEFYVQNISMIVRQLFSYIFIAP